MSGHEARINDALKQLGEEFRLGMVQAEEYRARRRALLESWGERDATTSPGSMRGKTATMPNKAPLKPARAAAESRKSAVPLVIVVVLIIAGAAAYYGLKPRAPTAGASSGAVPAAEPLSPQVLAVTRAADDFLAANAWDEAGINQFLGTWQPLSASDRAKAADQPSVRTLRHKLEQNIQAESQLIAADAPPEQRQRLTLLEGFARELAGGQ